MRKRILLVVSLLFILLSSLQLFIHIQTLKSQYKTHKARISQTLMDAHIRNLKTVLEGIFSQAQEFFTLEQQGKIPRNRAQERVKELVGAFRYGNQDYVWVNDLNHVIVVFPYAQWIGTNRIDYQSPDGKFPFKLIVETAKAKGEGFLEYQAYRVSQNVDLNQVNQDENQDARPKTQPKLSYFKLFQPWGWVFGTGVYIDDIQREETKLELELEQKIQAVILESVLLIIGVLLFSALLLFWRTKKLLLPLKKLMEVIHEINQGNLGARAQVKSSDEIGRLSLTFNTMADSIKDHTENLEEKVQQRTHELNQAFEEVNKLKTQQDGDYFLTSLLIKPLLINRVKSQKSRVEFFLKQKKDFIFRNRHSEIGGDVNIAHSITLRGKPYLIFVNGDAMGKSLQGAGGALVMGAVFNSMISRNSLLSQSQDMAPEIWLSECYQELQQIFEAFDGSMMISAIVGLFDENAGLMYYFNAEHPWPVLYRDGHAEFMEEETSLRKLGTVGFSEPLVIRTFQLQGGDAVIMGSDGKDDLLIGVDENSGLKIVNENERLFLNQVEKGEGDLLKIVEQLKILGELTDDLSLLKLSYGAEQESLDPENEQIKRRGAQFFSEQKYQLALEEFRKVLASQKDRDCYQQAALCLKNLGEKGQLALLLEESAKAFPADRNLLYQTSLAFKKEKSYEKALEYGLRVFLTEPGHLNNLINLSDLYRLSGQVVEAKKISAQAALLDPDNKHLARLIKMLE